MRSRKTAGVGMAIGAATTVTAMLVGATSAAANPTTRPETAFALAGQGLLNFGPLVQVASPDGQPVHAELAGLSTVPGLSALGISGGLLTSDATAGLATTSVADLTISALFTGELIKTTCENGRGSLEITNASVLGTPLPQFPLSGQTIDLSPAAKVTLGEEKRNTDGSITVTGIKISIIPLGTTLPPLPIAVPLLPGTSGTSGLLTVPSGLPIPGIPGAAGVSNAKVKPVAYATVDTLNASDTPQAPGTDAADDAAPSASADAPKAAAPKAAAPKAVAPKAESPKAEAPQVAASKAAASPVAAPGGLGIPGLPAIPGFPNLPTLPIPGLPIPTLPVPGQPVQTITIGSATCGTVDGNTGGEWGDGDDDHGDEPSADDAEGAPKPDVVEASLPVTG